jgi:hypothetical protein
MLTMKIKTIFRISLLVLILISCEKKNDYFKKSSDLFIGNWINPQYEDTIVTYSKSEKLILDQYGFTCNTDFSFVERKNAGWCGTPPISYSDYTGTWIENDSIVDISVGYWGGIVEYKWKVLSIDNQALKILQLSVDYNSNN